VTGEALERARQVADAVLYEGYLLYPYRASSAKNQVRWQFGVLGPLGAVDAMVGEPPSMHVDLLLAPEDDEANVDVRLRFLQAQWRAPQRSLAGEPDAFEPVEELVVGAARWIAWHEAVEQEVLVEAVGVDELLSGRSVEVDVKGGEEVEVVHDSEGAVVGRLVRTRFPLRGRLRLRAEPRPTTPRVFVVRLDVDNLAVLDDAGDAPRGARRDLAARQSFVGTHVLLTANGSQFVSVIDPPPWAEAAAAECGNDRCWPVLAGDRGDDERTSDIVLGAPIILGDYPEIAPQSPGQLFDSAEIDEILTLRIMTMTDEEKVAARATDPRAAAIIDRSDDLPPEVFERLHGVLHDLQPPTWFDEEADAAVDPETASTVVAGIEVRNGTRVRLCPRRRADVHDMFLAGRTAVVRRIDRDVDGQTHVAVLLEDDPALELHEWHRRYYYFGPDEIEPLGDAEGVESPARGPGA
jgi:hypothetical protein